MDKFVTRTVMSQPGQSTQKSTEVVLAVADVHCDLDGNRQVRQLLPPARKKFKEAASTKKFVTDDDKITILTSDVIDSQYQAQDEREISAESNIRVDFDKGEQAT